MKHFLNTQDWSRPELDALLDQARAFKQTKLGDQLKGKARRTTRTHFPKGQGPLIGLDETGRQVGVAVKLEQVHLPILLDTGLERVELTDIERQAALAAFDAEQEQRGEDHECDAGRRSRR